MEDGANFCPSCGAPAAEPKVNGQPGENENVNDNGAGAESTNQTAGTTGATGNTGATGTAGAAGNTGATGTAGAAGESFADKLKKLNDTPDTTDQYAKEDIEKNKAMGILCYLGILLLIPLFAAKDSKYVRFHLNQGLLLIIAAVIVSAAVGVVQGIAFALFFESLFALYVLFRTITSLCTLPIFVLMVIGIINVVNGRTKELPVIGKFKLIK